MGIPRCLYQVSDDDATIPALATKLGLDMLTLWAMNTALQDMRIERGQLIRTGVSYLTAQADSLQQLATVFGTSVRTLQSMNYDLQTLNPRQPLPARTDMCVLPDPCTP